MSFILWRSSFSVGNELIDNQHKMLIDIINRLYTGINKKDTQLKMQEIFNELVEYTKYHFNAEEELMMQNGYLHMTQHKKIHQEFVNKVNTLKLNNILTDDKLKMEVFKFLKSWLTDHIMSEDKKIFND